MKNIKSFCGKPLIWWNLHQLQEVDHIDEIVVATDCDEIGNVVNGFRFSKVKIYHRNEENAQDHSSTESVMLEYIAQSNLKNDDNLMLVQCTSVFSTKDHYREALELFQSSNKNSLLSCIESKQFFWDRNGSSINYDYNHRPRRQDFDGQYIENGALYVSKVSSIIESSNRLSGGIAIYIMPAHTAIELDEPIDWVIAESIMEKMMGREYPQV